MKRDQRSAQPQQWGLPPPRPDSTDYTQWSGASDSSERGRWQPSEPAADYRQPVRATPLSPPRILCHRFIWRVHFIVPGDRLSMTLLDILLCLNFWSYGSDHDLTCTCGWDSGSGLTWWSLDRRRKILDRNGLAKKRATMTTHRTGNTPRRHQISNMQPSTTKVERLLPTESPMTMTMILTTVVAQLCGAELQSMSRLKTGSK